MWDLIVSVPDQCLSFYFLSVGGCTDHRFPSLAGAEKGEKELAQVVSYSWYFCLLSWRSEKVPGQDQDSLLMKRRNDNHSPGPVIRGLVPSSHQRSELSNTILCIFSG